MNERLILRGKREELNARRLELASRIEAEISAIKEKLALSSVTPIERIDLDGVLVHAKDCARAKKEYLKILDDIRRIDEELG